MVKLVDRTGIMYGVDLEDASFNPVGLAVDTNNGVSPKCATAVPFDVRADMRGYVQDMGLAIADDQHISFGVPFEGEFINGQPMLFEFTGSGSALGDDPFWLRGFVARLDGATVSTAITANPNNCSNPRFFGNQNYGARQLNLFSTSVAFHERLIIGPFDNTASTNPIMFGIQVFNPSGGRTLLDVDFSFSVYRNKQGLQHFETG